MLSVVKNMSEGRRRILHVITLVIIVVGGLLILKSTAETMTLELALQKKPAQLQRAEVEVWLLPDEEMVHRTQFFFQPTEDPEVIAPKMRLQQGRRYRVSLILFPRTDERHESASVPTESPNDAPAPTKDSIQQFSREFLFQGESSLRLYF